MTLQQKQTIVENAKAYIALHEMSNADFGKKAGIRSEYLTHLFRENSDFTIPNGTGKATDIHEKYFRALADFLAIDLNPTYWKNIATPQFTAMLAILEDAKTFGTTNVIIGETGAGKTNTLNRFKRAHPMDVLIVTVGSNDNISDLIEKICNVLNITSGKSKSKKLKNIYDKLSFVRRT